MSRVGDFDFLFGQWTVQHRRLRQRGCGSCDWAEHFGNAETRPLLNGQCNIEEHSIAGTDASGIALRAFDTARNLWSIHWISGRDGLLQPPVIGGFEGDLGHFEGDDFDRDRPVRVRFLWNRSNSKSPRWAQSFSFDGGISWELNWTMQFERSRLSR